MEIFQNYNSFVDSFQAHITRIEIDKTCLTYLLQHCKLAIKLQIDHFVGTRNGLDVLGKSCTKVLVA